MSLSSSLLADARRLLAERLSAPSYEHCERVAAECVKLAARFGVDVADAELAGLLHDYAKDETDVGLLIMADELDVPVTSFEAAHPYLIHARVGAALARRDLPGIGEAVLSAVAVHTVGGLPMSDLDRVVYLADMIEPAREFPGVEALRAACERENLAECFRLGYGRSVRHVIEKGKPAHPISAAVGAEIERETGRALFEAPLVAEETADPGDAPGSELADAPDVEGAPGADDDTHAAEAPQGDDFAVVPDPDAAAEPAEAPDGEPERRIRRVRRRKAGRGPLDRVDDADDAGGESGDGAHSHTAAGAHRRHAGETHYLRAVGKWTLIGLLAVVLTAAAMAGVVLGINAFARWNALRLAGGGPLPTSDEENNLLVIGVQDGVATGFTALKLERSSGRVLGIAIPDGAFVEVPGQGFERIGSSFITGADVSKDTVSNYLGVSFPRFAVVDGETYQSLLASQDVASLMNQVTSTDLTEDERSSFAAYLEEVNPKNVWIVPLPVKPVSVGDQQYYEPQRDQVADLLLQWWGVKASEQKATPRVIVYNGVGTPGLAGLAAQQLIRTGFRIVNSGNADNFNYQTTQIYLYHGTQADARAVRDALGVGAIAVQSAPQELTDMIVIIGADYQPPVESGSAVPTEGVK